MISPHLVETWHFQIGIPHHPSGKMKRLRSESLDDGVYPVEPNIIIRKMYLNYFPHRHNIQSNPFNFRSWAPTFDCLPSPPPLFLFSIWTSVGRLDAFRLAYLTGKISRLVAARSPPA